MVILKLKSPLEEGYPSTGRRRTEGNPQGGPVVGNPRCALRRNEDMGREKEYRQRLKYQVSCVRRKTLESQIAGQLRNELGSSPAEARLLSRRMAVWLQRKEGFRAPNQIVMEASAGRNRFIRNGKGPTGGISLTPFALEDLELELEFGLKTMQAGRICRLLEQACDQDALLSMRQLTWLTNITPTSLRFRLASFRALGIYVPYLGLSRQARSNPSKLRSTWVLREYVRGRNVTEIRNVAAMSKARFEDLLRCFSAWSCDPHSCTPAGAREREEWMELMHSTPTSKLKQLFPASLEKEKRVEQEEEIIHELKNEFGMPPVKVRAVLALLREMKDGLSDERPEHTVVYWAVASHEPAGKPLEACALVPVRLTFVEASDVPDRQQDADFNCLRHMKVKKALRYATEAKRCGGYLTYADLGYLLGIHPAAISALVQKEEKTIIPLRGSECDIGRGVTHRREIIKMFLELYTETQISDRTGHSYESIENYIKEFGTVMVLHEQGMAVPMIRKVTGRSTRLIQVYLELLKEYSRPEYAFRFNYLRALVEAGENRPKKRGLRS